jgi:predicted RNA-binding protein (virulence factor B family)
MIAIGQHHDLEVLRDTSVGLYLGDDAGNEILLPYKYMPRGVQLGDTINVFVYKDNENRPIATTLEPKIELNKFASLQVAMTTKYGAFLDWGIEKQLFVPYREQTVRMKEGSWYLVYMYLDEKTNRLVASSRINRFLDNEELTVKEGEKIKVMFWEATDLGINVIINDLHKGLIYYNEFFSQAKKGETREGYIHKIREHNKIDVRLQASGYQNINVHADKIMKVLQENDGFLGLTDKSSPNEISYQLEMSKKSFKKGIGALYKQRLVRLEKDGVYLVK